MFNYTPESFGGTRSPQKTQRFARSETTKRQRAIRRSGIHQRLEASTRESLRRQNTVAYLSLRRQPDLVALPLAQNQEVDEVSDQQPGTNDEFQNPGDDRRAFQAKG